MHISKIPENSPVSSELSAFYTWLKEQHRDGDTVYSYNVMTSAFDWEWASEIFKKVAANARVYFVHGEDAYKLGARGAAIANGLCIFVG